MIIIIFMYFLLNLEYFEVNSHSTFFSYLGPLKLKSNALKWRCTRKETLNWNVKHPHHWLCNWLSCLPLVSQKFSSAPSLQSGSVSHHQLEIRHSLSGHLRNPTAHTEPVHYHIKLVALCLNHSLGFNNKHNWKLMSYIPILVTGTLQWIKCPANLLMSHSW